MNTKDKLIAAATTLIIVNDGATRWVGDQEQVYQWLRGHDLAREGDSVTMSAGEYQSLCDGTSCYLDSSGSVGPLNSPEAREFIEELQNLGAAYLRII